MLSDCEGEQRSSSDRRLDQPHGFEFRRRQARIGNESSDFLGGRRERRRQFDVSRVLFSGSLEVIHRSHLPAGFQDVPIVGLYP